MSGLFSNAPIADLRAAIGRGLDLLPDLELRHCHYIFSVTFERVLGEAATAKLVPTTARKKRKRAAKSARFSGNVVELFPRERGCDVPGPSVA